MKILQIDDNGDIRKFVDVIVASLGHKFESVDNGRDGVKKITENKYDMVLLDLSMPDYSGIDVVNELESKKLMGKQHVVVFSASVGVESRQDDLLKKGVHSFLSKPVDIDELTEKINSIEQSLDT